MNTEKVTRAPNLVIVHANIRSLVGKFSKFKDFIIENAPDIMLLSETWLKPEISTSQINVPKYNLIRKDRIGHAGGVAIYIKSHFNYCIIESVDTIEQLWIQVNFKDTKLIIGVVYNLHRRYYDDFLKAVYSSIMIILSCQKTYYY